MLSPDLLTARELLLAPEWLMLPEGPCPHMAVLVRDGRFAAVGPLTDIVAAHPRITPVVLPQRLLMAGLVDTHTHLTQSFGKALAFGEPSEIFRRIWVPMESMLDADAAYLAAKLSALESLRGGFTTVVDAGTRSEAGLEAVAAAARDVGIRCVLGMICNDAGLEGDESTTRRILDNASAFLARLEHDALVHPSLAISIPEAATDRMLHACGALNASALLAHATLLTPRELRLLRDSGAAVAYNPVASQWKGNAVLDAGLLGMLGVPFGLGTDGTRADGFRLMDAAEATQRLTHGLANGDSSCGGGWLWLDHGTHRGAEAAGLGAVTGRIAEGLAADFLLVDLDVPEFVPSWDLTWELVRLANRDQIEGVFVNGALRLWKGWPLDWDARALMREVAAIARRDVQRAPIQRVHPVADSHRAQQFRPTTTNG
jgi:cytosine/adenosine deaminase-related metal-dependent hydrolase